MRSPVVRFAPVSQVWLEAAHSTVLPTEAAARLGQWEHERYARHRTVAARAAYVHAHLLARDVLAQVASEAGQPGPAGLAGLAGQPVGFAQLCGGCGSTDHGAPYVPGRADLHVSLSHSQGWVAAMAAPVRCGIDVQVVGRVPDRALTEREIAVAGHDALLRNRFWARKEALIKAGVASLDDLGTLDVSDLDALIGLGGVSRIEEWTGADETVVGAWVSR